MEKVHLDPVEIDSTRTQVSLHAGTDDDGYGIWVAEAGPDWGDAAVEQYLAQLRYGQLPVDHRVPNRTVTIPLIIIPGSTFTFDQSRRLLQQKVALFVAEGGTLRRTLGNGRRIYLDIVSAQLHMSGSTLQASYDCDVDVVLTLECLPDWYGEEEHRGKQSAYTNVLTNPSFEAGTVSPWELSGVSSSGLSVSRASSPGAREGDSYAGFTVSSQNGSIDFRLGSSSMYSIRSVANEVAFLADVYVDGSVPSNGYRLVVAFYRSDRNATTGTLFGPVIDTGGRWVSLQLRGAIPPDAAYAQPIIRFGDDGSNTYSPYIDCLAFYELDPSEPTPPYFSGDTPGYKWDGDWADSTSSTSSLRAVVQVPGDYPARVNLALSSNEDQRGLMFAARPCGGSATAALDLPATGLTPLGGATRTTARGAAAVQRTSLIGSWVSVLSTRLYGGRNLTHHGPHRVWILCEPVGTEECSLRFDWVLGSQIGVNRGREVRVSDGIAWVDLGIVNINRVPVGEHEWEGKVLTNAARGSLRIWRVLVLPTAYAYGMVNAGTAPADASDLNAYDSFEGYTSGSIDRQVAPLGGTWTAASDGTIDAIQTVSGQSYAERVNVPTTRADQIAFLDGYRQAYVDVTLLMTPGPMSPAGIMTVGCGLVARYVDVRNHLRAYLHKLYTGAPYYQWTIVKVEAGTPTILAGQGWGQPGDPTKEFALRLICYPDGWVNFYVDGSLLFSVHDSALATGGALDDGSIGIMDYAYALISGLRCSRRYNLIHASSSTAVNDLVLFRGRTGVLCTAGYYRDDGSGVYAPMIVDGDNPRLPTSGVEGRDVEVYVNPTKAPIGSPMPDVAQSVNAVDVFVRPCYLFTPEAS